jgi:RNA polymerase sigma-70 factor (ECF subfamily)
MEHSSELTVGDQLRHYGKAGALVGKPPALSDLSLVLCAQSGESAAFDQLVRKYRPRVVTLAMRYTHNICDAEDAAQETFVKAYRGLRYFRRECTFYTWLHRIAINSAKNVLLARDRDPVHSATYLPDDSGSARYATQHQELDTPEELTRIDDIRDRVNAALEALPEAHRTAILLREIDGLSYREIAATMAIPLGTVRSSVFRARDAIDHELQQVCESGLGRHNGRRSPGRSFSVGLRRSAI